jgi:hypothetical protein
VVLALAERFWPGHLTLVARCDARVPNIVTAATQTVAVRVPAHAPDPARSDSVIPARFAPRTCHGARFKVRDRRSGAPWWLI